MGEIEPERFEFEVEQEDGQIKNQKRNDKEHEQAYKRTRISFDAEDILAIVAGIVALIFAIAMVAGSIPINTLTIGVVTLSGGGAAVAAVIKARKR